MSEIETRQESLVAAAQQCGRYIDEASKATGGIADLQVKAVNAMRNAGIWANVASGREQLVFNAAGFAFARKHIMPHLPEGATIEHLQFAVHLAGVLDKDVKTIGELRPYRREIQLLLGAFGVTDRPKREERTAQIKNHFVDVIYRSRMLGRVFETLVTEEPVEKWEDDKISEFLRDTGASRKWIDAVEAEARRRGLA